MYMNHDDKSFARPTTEQLCSTETKYSLCRIVIEIPIYLMYTKDDFISITSSVQFLLGPFVALLSVPQNRQKFH